MCKISNSMHQWRFLTSKCAKNTFADGALPQTPIVKLKMIPGHQLEDRAYSSEICPCIPYCLPQPVADGVGWVIASSTRIQSPLPSFRPRSSFKFDYAEKLVTVTLKPGLRVTECHWKWHQSIERR